MQFLPAPINYGVETIDMYALPVYALLCSKLWLIKIENSIHSKMDSTLPVTTVHASFRSLSNKTLPLSRVDPPYQCRVKVFFFSILVRNSLGIFLPNNTSAFLFPRRDVATLIASRSAPFSGPLHAFWGVYCTLPLPTKKECSQHFCFFVSGNAAPTSNEYFFSPLLTRTLH